MDSPNVHDDHQLQQQQFFHGINLDESYGSNYTPTISTSMNQDNFFQQSPHQWHHNFSFDQNHDLMSTELQLSSASLMFPNTTRTTITRNDHQFNHVFPSTNFSPSSDYGSTLFPRLNLKAFDLFTSTFDSEISSSTRIHQPLHGDSPTGSSNQILSRSNGITSTKRPAHIESKDSNSHTKTKKSKSSMPRSPIPTLKVRKEKLGDRIAALQKLVAPFGKTDTASVLTEAIGYIQFLHDQVQTLTVPYMNSSRNLGLERDLTSRGLSLVSHDCASFFVRSYNGSSI